MLQTEPIHWAQPNLIEAPWPFQNDADIVLDDGVGAAPNAGDFQRHLTTGRVITWRLRDVILDPRLGIAFKDREVVPMTRLLSYHGEEADAISRLERCRMMLRNRRAFVGFNRFCANYFHLLTQIVPAIAAYRAEPGFAGGLLILGAPNDFAIRALTLAGIELPEVMPVGPNLPPVAFEDLTFSSILTGCKAPSVFCQSVFSHMVAHACPSACPTPDIIYVSRRDAQARPMRNEAALEQMLARYGVTPILLSQRTIDEQIALFQNVRLVIGPHGAGLANVVFCRPGTVLYELLPDHLIRSCMNQLAQQAGVHYWSEVHRAEHAPGKWHHRTSWSVDIASVEHRLHEILAQYRIG